MTDTRYEEVDPDPKRVIEGLRDTGYQFETAIADIIDNSIAANASIIDLKLEMDFNGEISIRIADNGCGMNEEDLINAMRYGSRVRSDRASLGKFGLGLKTASTAFCRQLSVVTRDSGDSRTRKATWDLDHVASEGKWELRISDPTSEDSSSLNTIAGDGSGTVVLWEKIDRLLKNYAAPGGGFAQNALKRYVRDLKDHVSMVYQRFLDSSDKRAKNIAIIINGESVESWDPFCTAQSKIVADQPDVEVELDNGKHAGFSIRAYVLPRKEEFGSPELAKQARLTNDRQGIYVYRENRLIHGPDWMGMYQSEPHLTLLRIEFSFDHKLDEAFHIDIKKSQILLNEDLFNWLKQEFLPAPRRAAAQSYRTGLNTKANDAAKSAHDSSNISIHEKAEDLRTAKTAVLDQANNIVQITNRHGTTKLKIKVSNARKPGEVHIQPAESIIDGLLWEPAIIDGNQGVSLNTSHPYYQKVYLPNRKSGVTIQGLDSMMWALCAAELGTISDTTKKHFEELRYEVSKLLRSLVEDLPDPDLNGNESEN
jgi:hypothetical protein